MAKKRLTTAERKNKKLLEKKAKKPGALQNPKTRRLAIHAQCHECIYDPGEPGGWRKQVEACTATDCPLYGFRPMTINAERAKTTASKK